MAVRFAGSLAGLASYLSNRAAVHRASGAFLPCSCP